MHITYRSEGNAKLLLDYGFAEDLALTPPAGGITYPSYEAVRLALPPTTLAKVTTFVIGQGKLSQDGASVARTLLLGTEANDEAALATLRRQLAPAYSNDAAADADAWEAGLDRAVCAALLAACEGELRRLPTSEAEDRAALQSLESSLESAAPPPDGVEAGRWRNALAFRLGQKAHLAAMSQALGALLADGEAPTAASTASVCSALRALRSE